MLSPSCRGEVFVLLLGWGVLLHKVAKADFLTSWFSALATIAAFAMIVRPSRPEPVGALFVGIIGQVLMGFDLFGNHWPFLGLLGFGWFAAWASSGAGLGASAGTVCERFFPLARLAWMAMWVVVAVHKFNRGFFDAPQSCAIQLYEQSRSLLRFLPDLAELTPSALPPVVALAEAAIAVGLIVPRLRPVAVLLGLGFHLLSGAAVPSFGGLAMAFYVPFLGSEVVNASLSALRSMERRLPLLRAAPLIAVGGMGVIAIANGYANLTDRPPFNEVRSAGAAVVLTGTGLIICYGLGLWLARGPGQPVTIGRPGPVGLAIVALVGLIGIAPYLGLRTENSLSMFSNLRTEEGVWNHLLVPEAVQLFHHQGPLIRVRETEVENIERVSRRLELPLSKVRFVEADLARRITLHCGARTDPAEAAGGVSMTVMRNGEWEVVDDVCTDDSLTTPSGVMWERIMLFRAVPDVNRCQH